MRSSENCCTFSEIVGPVEIYALLQNLLLASKLKLLSQNCRVMVKIEAQLVVIRLDDRILYVEFLKKCISFDGRNKF